MLNALVLGEEDVRARQLESGWMVVSAKGNWTARGPGGELPSKSAVPAAGQPASGGSQ